MTENRARERVRVRPATADDVETLFEIRTSVRENFESRAGLARKGITPASVIGMMERDGGAWVGEIDGVPAAFSMAKGEQRTVFAVFVRPEHEGKGLGRAVLCAAEQWLWERGAQEIWLTTGKEPANRAHGFYRRLGWRARGAAGDGEVFYAKTRPARGE